MRLISTIPTVTIWVLVFSAIAGADDANQQTSQRFYVQHSLAPKGPPPHETIDPQRSELIYFNRLKPLPPENSMDPAVMAAITNSNTLLSGTVIRHNGVAGCWTYDWTTTVLSEESSSVIIYQPSDVSVYCDPQPASPAPADPMHPPAQDPNQRANLYVVVPVKAIWAEVSGFRGDLNDPARKPPGPLSGVPYCWSNVQASPSPEPAQGIAPCDVDENWIRHRYYKSGWLYNRLTAPGGWAGSFSIAPQVVQKASQTLTEDIRFNGWTKAGYGWLGLNVMFEKGAAPASNLDSLTGGLVYDVHLSQMPWWGYTESTTNEGIGVRPGEFVFSTGPEYADTRTKGPSGQHYPKDLNFMEGIYYKQPFSVTAFSYPSFLTFFPLVGAEGGWHLIRYQQDESAQFFRKVVGADASIRYPFHKAPNFTSTKGATLDYSLRERFLSGYEPYTDTHPLDAMGDLLPVTPILSRQRRSYSRIAVTWPFSNYVSLNVTVQRGSLPPDFQSVSWTLTVGLAFASSGTAEH